MGKARYSAKSIRFVIPKPKLGLGCGLGLGIGLGFGIMNLVLYLDK